MKKILITLGLFLLVSCGSKRDKPFSPCSVTKEDNITTIKCLDGTETEIIDGNDGKDGLDGTSVEVIQLCPEITGSYPEILLRIEGRLYAVLDGGPNLDRLVEVGPGSYQTTDGRACNFTVTEDLEIE